MSELLKAIAVTAELTQTELSKHALLAMESDLSEYPLPMVLSALTRCRRELSGRLTPAEVIKRVEAIDGRPGANEAWGVAMLAFDEQSTVMLNDEIAEAMTAARPIMAAGDEVGARMAFRDAYERVSRIGRESRAPVRWWPSLGADPALRVAALNEAVSRGLLSHQQAAGYLPPPPASGDGAAVAGLLSGNVDAKPSASAMKHFVKLKRILAKSAK